MHGGVFTEKALAEATFILEKEVAMAVVMKQTLGQIEQSTKLAQGVAVGFHLPSIVSYSEEDTASVGSNVAPLVDDVEKAAAHNLCVKQKVLLKF